MIAALASVLALGGLLLGQQVTVPPERTPLTENRAPVPVNTPPGMMTAPSHQVDRWFAAAAQDSSNAEPAMAQLALRRGHADEVKSYARKMIAEHVGLQKALAPHLQRITGIAPKHALGPADALTYYRLQHVSDVAFDQT